MSENVSVFPDIVTTVGCLVPLKTVGDGHRLLDFSVLEKSESA